jgi:hypothetical protein
VKKTIITLAMVFTIAIAMTGIAAAASIKVVDSTGAERQTFNPGEEVYVTGDGLSGATASSVDIYLTDNVQWGNGDSITGRTPDIVYFKIDTFDKAVNSPNKVLLGTVANPAGGTNIPYPNVFDGTSGGYDVVYDADENGIYNTDGGDAVDYMACSGFDTIPEFATIAIPAVAILGLFLFFNRRKRREE